MTKSYFKPLLRIFKGYKLILIFKKKSLQKPRKRLLIATFDLNNHINIFKNIKIFIDFKVFKKI